jgi:pyridoxine 5'-phosphate synthase PdxJ
MATISLVAAISKFNGASIALRIAAIAEMEELNIGHFLIGVSVFCGLEAAIVKMCHLMDAARNNDRHRKNA